MSYRKKHNPTKQEPEVPVSHWEYSNPGVESMIYTSKLTSSQPYQRPVNPKAVERLIREWDDRLFEPLTVSFRNGHFL